MERPDFDRVAELYIESAEAEHGDRDLARWQAEVWWQLFQVARAEAEDA